MSFGASRSFLSGSASSGIMLDSMSCLFYGYSILCLSSIPQLVEGLYWKGPLVLFFCSLNSLTVLFPVLLPSFFFLYSRYFAEGNSVFNHLMEFTSKKMPNNCIVFIPINLYEESAGLFLCFPITLLLNFSALPCFSEQFANALPPVPIRVS
jgi:hypothetical protein